MNEPPVPIDPDEDPIPADVEILEGGVVLRPPPEVDWRGLAFADQIDAVLVDRPDRLVMDLTRVSFVDSAGVGRLIRTLQATRSYGGRFVLCGVGEDIRAILEITKLESMFTIVTTVAEAMDV